jgi:hypothetical protein
MVASVDGRTLTSRWRPENAERRRHLEPLHDRLGVDAWLVGRVTGQEYAKPGDGRGFFACRYYITSATRPEAAPAAPHSLVKRILGTICLTISVGRPFVPDAGLAIAMSTRLVEGQPVDIPRQGEGQSAALRGSFGDSRQTQCSILVSLRRPSVL